jgi:hypothetical protein
MATAATLTEKLYARRGAGGGGALGRGAGGGAGGDGALPNHTRYDALDTQEYD